MTDVLTLDLTDKELSRLNTTFIFNITDEEVEKFKTNWEFLDEDENVEYSDEKLKLKEEGESLFNLLKQGKIPIYKPPVKEPKSRGEKWESTSSKLCSVDSSEWKMKSSCKCWYCMLGFDTVPLGIPTKIETNQRDKDITFHLYGNFCSFDCMYTYLTRGGDPTVDQCDFYELEERMRLVKLLHTSCGLATQLNILPPIRVREDFGGSVKIEDWFSKCVKVEVLPVLVKPSVIATKISKLGESTRKKRRDETYEESED